MSPWFVLACVVLAAGCGKKGAPLAPIVRIPAAVEQIAARRVGSEVYVTLTVPTVNVDASIPADVDRIDVYGYTGVVPPSRARWAVLGTVVASVPVVPAPRPGDSPAAPPDPAAGAVQGAAVTVVDVLSADELAQGRVDPPIPARRGAVPLPVSTAPPLPVRRFYLAIPFGPRERPGPPGAQAELPLTEVPDPPSDLTVAYNPTGVRLTWAPSGGLIGFILNREMPREAPPFDEVVAPATTPPAAAGPIGYNVYLELAPDPFALPGAAAPPVPWRATPPLPLNAAPLAALTTTDAIEFERERCYSLRAVRGAAPNQLESEPTPRTCVRPVDVFPPAPPSGLAAVAGEGAISLIWEPSNELDAGGYLVLRGAAGDATLQPLTPLPIFETSFRDAAVSAGRRYVYAVVAVDDRLPIGNMSAPSGRVEETAR